MLRKAHTHLGRVVVQKHNVQLGVVDQEWHKGLSWYSSTRKLIKTLSVYK